MQKNFILEIERNLEIMGISEQVDLIAMNPLNYFIEKMNINSGGKVIRNLDDFTKEIEKGLTNEGAERLNSIFRKSLDYLAKKKILSTEERIFISALCRRYFSDYLNRVYANMERAIIGRIGDPLWQKMKKVIADETKSTEEIYNILKDPKYFGPNLTIESTQILRDMIKNRPLSLSVPSTIPPKIFTQTERNLIVAERAWDDITSWDKESIEKLRRRNTKWYNFYLRFCDEIIAIFQSRYKLMLETQQLIKTYETTGTRDPMLLKQIGENLLILARRERQDFIYMKNWISENVPMTSSIYTDHFKKAIQTDDSYKLAESLISNSEKLTKWQESVGGDFSKRRTIVRQTGIKMIVDFITYPFRRFSKTFNKFFDESIKKKLGDNTDWRKFLNDILYGKTITNAQIKEYAKIFGLEKVAKLVSKEYLVGIIISNFIIALGLAIYDGIAGAYLGFDKKAQARYKEVVNSPGIEKLVKKYIPNDKFGLQSLAELLLLYGSYVQHQYSTFGAVIPGAWDDLAIWAIQMGKKLLVRTPEQIEETNQDNNELNRRLQNLQDSVSNYQNQLENRETQRIPGTKEKVRAYVTDPSGVVRMKEPLTFTPEEDGALIYTVKDSNGLELKIFMKNDGQSVETWETIEN